MEQGRIVIRPARAVDAEAIAEVQVESWQDAYPGLLPNNGLLNMNPRRLSSQWRATTLRRGRERVHVANTKSDGIVGFASWGPARAQLQSLRGEVFTLYVRPDWQNRGLGRALLRAAFKGLRAAGHPSAVVWVISGSPARFFYERMGGVRLAKGEDTLWGTSIPLVAYGWSDLKSALNNRKTAA
ncbi:MAG: GNAT family N-acetyltransferase [Alphaproteobacteria bacterium]|nr:GNAT family N-acetyltransferase [Alphaproteobacteria bacterium]